MVISGIRDRLFSFSRDNAGISYFILFRIAWNSGNYQIYVI
jgi:hypothetical protein